MLDVAIHHPVEDHEIRPLFDLFAAVAGHHAIFVGGTVVLALHDHHFARLAPATRGIDDHHPVHSVGDMRERWDGAALVKKRPGYAGAKGVAQVALAFG